MARDRGRRKAPSAHIQGNLANAHFRLRRRSSPLPSSPRSELPGILTLNHAYKGKQLVSGTDRSLSIVIAGRLDTVVFVGRYHCTDKPRGVLGSAASPGSVGSAGLGQLRSGLLVAVSDRPLFIGHAPSPACGRGLGVRVGQKKAQPEKALIGRFAPPSPASGRRDAAPRLFPPQ